MATQAKLNPVDYAEEQEAQMIWKLEEAVVVKSVYSNSGERDPTLPIPRGHNWSTTRFLMGDDPRLQKMPEKPTLIDYFKLRFAPSAHVLQSAALAKRAGCNETVQMACLMHDIAVVGFIRGDHGYWGAQMIEPYVSEEISWAVRAHQALRFYADEENGYEYPTNYLNWFGEDYRPDPHIQRAYEEYRQHKWYMTARLVTMNDIYSFDPNAVVNIEDFEDLIGRNFKQPKEGLGFDNSPSAHMWRTIMRPTRFL